MEKREAATAAPFTDTTPCGAGALRRAGSGAVSIGAVIAAALVPKCPLCIAAMLSAAGVGAAVARDLAPFVRGLSLALAMGLAALVAAAEWRRAQVRKRLAARRAGTTGDLRGAPLASTDSSICRCTRASSCGVSGRS
jgi:hypothetical protein